MSMLSTPSILTIVSILSILSILSTPSILSFASSSPATRAASFRCAASARCYNAAIPRPAAGTKEEPKPMDLLTDPNTWISFVTLVALEIVLGVDNVIFISVLAGKLPAEQRGRARSTGHRPGSHLPAAAPALALLGHRPHPTAVHGRRIPGIRARHRPAGGRSLSAGQGHTGDPPEAGGHRGPRLGQGGALVPQRPHPGDATGRGLFAGFGDHGRWHG